MEHFELSHDILGPVISDMVEPELKLRREVQSFILKRHDPERPQSLLNKEDLEYINPHLSALRLSPELSTFVKRSLQAQRLKRLRWILLISALILVLAVSSTVFFYQSRKFRGLYLISQAREIVRTNPTHALDTALLAIQTFDNVVVQEQLYNIYGGDKAFYQVVSEHKAQIEHALFHEKGEKIYFSLKNEDGSGYYPILSYHLPSGKTDTLSSRNDEIRPYFDISQLLFSSDSSVLIAASNSGDFYMWELENETILSRDSIPNPNKDYLSMLALPDTSLLWTYIQKKVYLWDSQEKKIAKEESLSSNVVDAFYMERGQVVYVLEDGTLMGYEYRTGKRDTLLPSNDHILSVIKGENGEILLLEKPNQLSVYVHSESSNSLVLKSEETIDHSRITSLFSSPTKETLYTIDVSKALLFTREGKMIYELLGHEAAIRGIFRYEDEIYTASLDGTIRKWQVPRAAAVWREKLAYITSIQNSADSNIYVSSGNQVYQGRIDGSAISFEDTSSFPNMAQINGLDVSESGELLVGGSGSSQLYLQTATETLEKQFSGFFSQVEKVAIHPRGDYFVSSMGASTATLWRSTGDSLTSLLGHKEAISSIAFSPNGDNILTSSADGSMRLWDLEGKTIKILENGYGINRCLFSPDGRHILSCDNQADTASIYLWNWRGEKEKIFRLSGSDQQQIFMDLSFHPSGEMFASLSADGQLQLWEVAGEACIYSYPVISDEAGKIQRIAFSADGHYLVAATAEELLLYHVDKQPLAAFTSRR
ncbi:MAG: WD40 repeat domain-containing protein [Bacteroidota bacterium]